MKEMGEKLCVSFSDEEIEQALFHMGPTKAQGRTTCWLCFTSATGGVKDDVSCGSRFSALGKCIKFFQ